MSNLEYYRISPEDTALELKTSLEGLSETERASRIAVYGSNALQVQAGTSKLESLMNQFKDLMVILLIVSAGFSVYLEDYRTASILAIIIVVNI
jgi:Ca2+-transporting ATPase